MSKEDPFEEIVRRLDLDLPFSTPDPTPEAPEDFYRTVQPPPPQRLRHGHFLALLGIIGAPAIVMVASLVHYILPRPILLGTALLFTASAIYLIAQLPERGPAEPGWPDDGAQL